MTATQRKESPSVALSIASRSSLVETLDQWEAQMIAEFLSSFSISILRASCQWTSLVVAVHTVKDKHDIDWMLCYVAKSGHRDLCELAREWGATNFDQMLFDAAKGGHRDLCELAREWGATDR